MKKQSFTTSFSVDQSRKKALMPSTMFGDGGHKNLTVVPKSSVTSSRFVKKHPL
jgi:hypothetical protein